MRFDEASTKRIANVVRIVERQLERPRRIALAAQGSAISYFVLAEDAVSLPVYAWQGVFDEATGGIDIDPDATEPFELFYWLDVLSSPKIAEAGYAGIYGIDAAGLAVFVNGPCIGGCQTVASIDPGTPPAGEVGTAYTHTVVISGLDFNGVTADGLPPGLSLAITGQITGTPVTAGVYFVTFMGNSDDAPPCALTRVVQITITEEQL